MNNSAPDTLLDLSVDEGQLDSELALLTAEDEALESAEGEQARPTLATYQAAGALVARLLQERGNIPEQWLAGVSLDVQANSLRVGFADSAGLAGVELTNQDGRWQVSGDALGSFKSGAMVLQLAEKGATGQSQVHRVGASSAELPGACSLLCEVIEREAANQKVLQYFREGGAQALKATSYALARNRISGVSPVLANADETKVHAVCFKRNQHLGFAGVVVDKTPEFAVVCASTTGLHGFVPLEMFKNAQGLAIGDPVALRVSPTKGLSTYPIEYEQLREAVILACGCEAESPDMNRVREYLANQFGDKELAFSDEGHAPRLSPALSMETSHQAREGLELLRLRKSWQAVSPDLESITAALDSLKMNIPGGAEQLEDKAFGSVDLTLRKTPSGELQARIVTEDQGVYTVEAIQLSPHGEPARCQSTTNLFSPEAARAAGEKLSQRLLSPGSLGPARSTRMAVKGRVSDQVDMAASQPLAQKAPVRAAESRAR